MPYLGDFLGLVLSELTVARMQADLETVRIAELYASHPLLKLMPVPHLRLPEVEAEIPVVIKQQQEPRAGESARGGAPLADLRKKFDEVLDAQLARSGRAIAPAEREKLRAALDLSVAKLRQPAETAVDVGRAADAFAEVAVKFVPEAAAARPAGVAAAPGSAGAAGAAPPQPFAAELKEAARLEFLKLRSAPPRLMALVTSAEVREAGGAEQIARLRLKITEQGLEWATVESEGRSQDRLVPE